ncbi:hypothetical protein [Crocosphaera sp. XPORK-15E]|uniref:hypothetical protein n=1 Tax=Crocosphaera sp. XPORK-15E TaxID=3110247 RepID=UPI002B39D08E|nr:hypothetical protein [Crocosphaera sp. XPORK-15E]
MIRKNPSRPINLPKLFVIFLLSVSLTWGIGQILGRGFAHWGLQPVNAQDLRPEQAAAIIYQKQPDLPKENQYKSVETGEIDPNHTLISRFIRYHRDFKRRSSLLGLDWKITLADYLGINQSIRENNYPGVSTLTTSPLEADIEAIRQLNRRQRQALVDELVKLYTPETPKTTTETEGKPALENPATPTPSTPGLSKPGDAQLLIP